jgi:hypothetical protein
MFFVDVAAAAWTLERNLCVSCGRRQALKGHTARAFARLHGQRLFLGWFVLRSSSNSSTICVASVWSVWQAAGSEADTQHEPCMAAWTELVSRLVCADMVGA